VTHERRVVPDKEAITKEITLAASPEEVYAFLTEPEKVAKWIGTAIDIDPRPGGIFRIVPNQRDVILGEYLETIPHKKVSFTWGFDGEGHTVSAGSTVVEITLEPEGAGTRLRLVHRGLSGEDRDQHALGWDHYLSRIRTVSEGGDPGVDPLSDPSIRHGRKVFRNLS
jgi:uncharacterized protein YndB with AHSA1/START domain